MGRLIITSDVPGCRETVTDRINEFLFLPMHTNALIKAIERFINDHYLID